MSWLVVFSIFFIFKTLLSSKLSLNLIILLIDVLFNLLKYLGYLLHKYNIQFISMINLVLINACSEKAFLISGILLAYLLSSGEILL